MELLVLPVVHLIALARSTRHLCGPPRLKPLVLLGAYAAFSGRYECNCELIT